MDIQDNSIISALLKEQKRLLESVGLILNSKYDHNQVISKERVTDIIELYFAGHEDSYSHMKALTDLIKGL